MRASCVSSSSANEPYSRTELQSSDFSGRDKYLGLSAEATDHPGSDTNQVSEMREIGIYQGSRTHQPHPADAKFGGKRTRGLHSDSAGLRKSVHDLPSRPAATRLGTRSAIGAQCQHMRTPCLTWAGGTDARGRPRIWADGGNRLAIRLALAAAGATVSPGQATVHLCGNRTCVRPQHIVACDLPTAQRLRRRGASPLGPGDLVMLATVVRRREASIRDVSLAADLSRPIVIRIAQECLHLRKRRSDCRKPKPRFYLRAAGLAPADR